MVEDIHNEAIRKIQNRIKNWLLKATKEYFWCDNVEETPCLSLLSTAIDLDMDQETTKQAP